MSHRSVIPLALASVILLALIPFVSEPFIVKTITEVLIFGIFAMSLDLLIGYTGLVSFGHAAFFGIGAYAAGYFAQKISPNLLVTCHLRSSSSPLLHL
jgi:branched-chain amino acid transport system permease protein